MRLLLLGTSHDQESFSGASVPLGSQGVGFRRLQAAFAGQLGYSINAHLLIAWPDPRLPAVVARRLDALQPDVVLLHCSSIATVPLGVRRHLRLLIRGATSAPAGRPTVPAGDSSAGNAPPARSRRVMVAFGSAVAIALAWTGVGHRSMLPLDGVIATYAAVIAHVAARPGVALAVRGPTWSGANATSHYWHRHTLRRLEVLDVRMSELCAELDIPYASMLRAMQPEPARMVLGDGHHLNVLGQALLADVDLSLLVPLVARLREVRKPPIAPIPPWRRAMLTAGRALTSRAARTLVRSGVVAAVLLGALQGTLQSPDEADAMTLAGQQLLELLATLRHG